MGEFMWRSRPASTPARPTPGTNSRLEPTEGKPRHRVHPGHDWFVVIAGRVRRWLGDREIDVETGEAAEFATMTPHAFWPSRSKITTRAGAAHP